MRISLARRIRLSARQLPKRYLDPTGARRNSGPLDVRVTLYWECDVSLYSGAVRQPLNDLAEFDLTRRQPEEMARLFARWKEQRRFLQGNQPPPNGRKGGEQTMPAVIPSSTVRQAAFPPPATQPASGSIRYSAPFVAMLVADRDRAIADHLKTLRFDPAEAAPLHAARRRMKLHWVFTGMPWILAVAALAALFWQQVPPLRIAVTQSDVRAAPATHSSAVQVHSDIASAESAAPTANHSGRARLATPVAAEVHPAARLIPAAIEPPVQTALPVQAAIDAALMRTMPSASDVAQIRPKLKPRPVAVQMANKAPAAQELAPARPIELLPMAAPKEITSAQEARVENPATATIDVPAPNLPPPLPQTVAIPESRPASLDMRGNDKTGFGAKAGDHAAKMSRGDNSGGTGSTGTSSGAGDGGTGSSGDGTGDSGGSGTAGGTGGDTGSGDSGGTGASGGGSGAGSNSGGSGGSSGSGGSDSGGSGDTGGSGSGSSDAGSGGAGSGDTGSGGTGTGGTGTGGTGAGGTGAGGTGAGGAGSGDAGSGDAGSGGAGSGGASSGDAGSGGAGSGDAGSGGAGSGSAGSGGGGSDAGAGGTGDSGGGIGGSGGSTGGAGLQ
ncbi:MAG TPA: hypothetical protein VGJ75_09055 [Dongiaceae bacterium]